MTRKTFFCTTLLFAFSLIISACGNLSTLTTHTSSSTSYQYNYSKLASNPVQSKLAIGILTLANTDLAITSDQSKELLLLWKGVKSLSNDPNTTEAEIAALYQQIEDTLSPEQMAAIQKRSWNEAEIQALQKQYASQAWQDDAASRTTHSKTQAISNITPGGTSAGGPPVGEPPSGDMAMMDLGGGGILQSGIPTQQTPQPASSAQSSGVNVNLLFANSVIQLLQQQLIDL
jgi:hypothetical protein